MPSKPHALYTIINTATGNLAYWTLACLKVREEGDPHPADQAVEKAKSLTLETGQIHFACVACSGQGPARTLDALLTEVCVRQLMGFSTKEPKED